MIIAGSTNMPTPITHSDSANDLRSSPTQLDPDLCPHTTATNGTRYVVEMRLRGRAPR